MWKYTRDEKPEIGRRVVVELRDGRVIEGIVETPENSESKWVTFGFKHYSLSGGDERWVYLDDREGAPSKVEKELCDEEATWHIGDLSVTISRDRVPPDAASLHINRDGEIVYFSLLNWIGDSPSFNKLGDVPKVKGLTRSSESCISLPKNWGRKVE